MKFYQYLELKGLLNAPKALQEQAWDEWKKLQKQANSKKFRDSHTRIELNVKNAQNTEIEELAQKYYLSKSKIILAGFWSYFRSQFLVPNKSALQEMRLEVREGNNYLASIYDICKKANPDLVTNVASCIRTVESMDYKLTKSITNPTQIFRPDFMDYVD